MSRSWAFTQTTPSETHVGWPVFLFPSLGGYWWLAMRITIVIFGTQCMRREQEWYLVTKIECHVWECQRMEWHFAPDLGTPFLKSGIDFTKKEFSAYSIAENMKLKWFIAQWKDLIKKSNKTNDEKIKFGCISHYETQKISWLVCKQENRTTW